MTTQPVGTQLTGRETQILRLIAYGMETKDVTEQLGITTETVRTHRKRIIRKLGARNMVAAAVTGVVEGLI